MKPRVAVFGVFDKLESAYSLSNVVADQLKALSRHGYPTQFWALEDYDYYNDPMMLSIVEECSDNPIEIKTGVARIETIDYANVTQKVDKGFEGKVERCISCLQDVLADVDVVLTHDIIFQTWFLPYNIAVRRIASQFPKVKWLHWIHSAPSDPPSVTTTFSKIGDFYTPAIIYPHSARFSGMENSKFVFLNHTDKARMVQMIGVKDTDVVICPNGRDICDYFDMHPQSKEYIRSNNLIDADVLIVYPTRICEAKQPLKAVRIAGGIAYAGRKTKLVFANSYSTSPDEKMLVERYKDEADRCGLGRDNLLFTSEAYPEWQLYCPSKSVKDLQRIADLFVLPSVSEGCSLVALEAALCRNLCLLNDDFPPMREWFGFDAIYGKFSSALLTTTYQRLGCSPEEAEDWYYRELAASIIQEIESNKVLSAFRKMKQHYNSDFIFKWYVEPLILDVNYH